jgi:hypothetical protein
MSINSQIEDGTVILRNRLQSGVSASPLCIAIIGWLSDTPTIPSVSEIQRTADGRIRLRLSGEKNLEPLCTLLEFLDQVRVICDSLQMTEGQCRQMISLARRRLG